MDLNATAKHLEALADGLEGKHLFGQQPQAADPKKAAKELRQIASDLRRGAADEGRTNPLRE